MNVTALAHAIATGLLVTTFYWLMPFNHGNPLASDLRYFVAAGMIAAFFEPAHWGLRARLVYTAAFTMWRKRSQSNWTLDLSKIEVKSLPRPVEGDPFLP